MISPLNKGVTQGGGAAPAQNQVIALRVAIIGAVLLGLFAIVFFRLWYLQVLSGDSLAAAATKNRVRKVPVTAPRGEIQDRNGKTLVSNRRAQIVELAPGSLPMLERAVANQYGQDLQTWTNTLLEKYGRTRVSKWKKVPDFALAIYPRPKYPALDDPDLVRDYIDEDRSADLARLKTRYRDLGDLLQLPADEIRRRVINSLYLLPYANVPLSKTKSAPAEVVEYVAENAERFPGVSTTLKYVRSYPLHEVGAQLFGQVGPVPTDEDGKSTIDKYAGFNTASQVGVNGLELEYDGELRGQDGMVKANIDAFGNVQGVPEQIAPKPGNFLQLTIDRDLQEEAQKQLAAYSKFNPGNKPGAAVALDPRTGAILASVSNPSFDPNDLVRGVSEEEFKKFTDPNGSKPLFNRVTDGSYPAASTFKLVTSLAALDSGVTTASETYSDTGIWKTADREFTNAGKTAYGSVNMERALQVSSDTFFYEVGSRMNRMKGDPLQTWARKLGYDRRTGIDLPGENSGTIPDVAWRAERAKEETDCRRKEKIPQNADVYFAGANGCGLSDKRPWSIGDQVNLSVGQGDVQVTPLQTAVAYSAIENGGTIVRPHLAKSTQNRQGETIQTFQFRPKRKLQLDPVALSTIRSGLHKAASEAGGTSAGVFADWPQDRYPIYGKTGTAERGEGRPDQSWYVAYVPDPVRPITIVVTIEGGGFGAAAAAPIAGTLLKKWFRVSDAKITAAEGNSR